MFCHKSEKEGDCKCWNDWLWLVNDYLRWW
jgi:hypothetical protein